MKNPWIWIVLAIIIIAALAWYISKNKKATATTPAVVGTNAEETVPTTCPAGWRKIGDGSACVNESNLNQNCALFGNPDLQRCTDAVGVSWQDFNNTPMLGMGTPNCVYNTVVQGYVTEYASTGLAQAPRRRQIKRIIESMCPEALHLLKRN